MFKNLLCLAIVISIISCNSLKQVEQSLANGNYDLAINKSLHYLKKNRFGKKAPEYNQLLWEAYQKASDKDHREISFLKTDKNPANLEKIYNLFVGLENRQEKIRPLLPIKGHSFKLENYNVSIVQSKHLLSDYLYAEAKTKFKSGDKLLIREAHEDFKYLESINTDFEDTRMLISQSYSKGLEFVLVSLKNNTEQVIPSRLQKQLLDIHEYKLDSYWIVHHGKRLNGVKYDYNLILSFNKISISPEQVKEVHMIKKKQVVDGLEYVLDQNGNVKKDNKGNDVKQDRIIEVKSTFHQFTQFKQCTITAQSILVDQKSQQAISKTPYKSTFIFEHLYATHTGDKRALSNNYLNMLKHAKVDFPSNDQMILDAGNDIKNKLGKQLKNFHF